MNNALIGINVLQIGVQGVDALLHVSQISREHVDKPSDVLSVGQVITAKVVDFNEADRKISLSMKLLRIRKQKKTNQTVDASFSSDR